MSMLRFELESKAASPQNLELELRLLVIAGGPDETLPPFSIILMSWLHWAYLARARRHFFTGFRQT